LLSPVRESWNQVAHAGNEQTIATAAPSVPPMRLGPTGPCLSRYRLALRPPATSDNHQRQDADSMMDLLIASVPISKVCWLWLDANRRRRGKEFC